MQKIYEELLEIDNSTFGINAEDVAIGEMVRIDKKDGTRLYGSVIRFEKTKVTVQVMGPVRGLSTNDRVVFLKKAMSVVVGDHILGRILNSLGEPIDGGPAIEGTRVAIGTPPANPIRRVVAEGMIHTNIPMIDLFNCLVESQKIPIFSVAGEPYNQLLMRIANQTDADVVLIGIMAARYDDIHAFIENAKKMGSLQKTTMFVHKATDYPVECLLVPDMVLTVAEQFAEQGKRVLVLLTDMTAFADALKEIAISLEQVPSNRGYPGSLYSDLASRYEKAIDIEGLGSITIVAATTMPGDDVTHPIPDNTGYITEGQFYLRGGRIELFGSLSRLKQNVIGGKSSRDDHSALMNTLVRFYAAALKARELYSMGFKLSSWDEKLIKFGDLFEAKLMDLEVNIPLYEALDLGWVILGLCFDAKEVGIKQDLIDRYWKS